MIAIRPLLHFDPNRFQAIASGYTTTQIYRVDWSESYERVAFTLLLEALPGPRTFHFVYDDEELDHYGALIPSDDCLGAYDGDLLVGVALAAPRRWNETLRVWEFHVAETHRGRGIGRRLMTALEGRARAAGLRALVCETQNTNIPAIGFYRAVGFTLEGIDVSYYSNDDMSPGGTVAVFMKLRIK